MTIFTIAPRIGAALTMHRVASVRENIKKYDVTSPEWEELVVAEVLILVTETLPTLSAGWRGGAAGLCLTCWVLAASYVTWALYTDSMEGQVESLLIALVAAGFPVLLLWDLADVSTECDYLVVDLNDKRTDDPSDEADLAIMKLETMLGHLNKNQGMHTYIQLYVGPPYHTTTVANRRWLGTFSHVH